MNQPHPDAPEKRLVSLEERLENGYLPHHPPLYRKLLRFRSDLPLVLSPLPIQSKLARSPRRKAKKGLKTPRLMLPILLG